MVGEKELQHRASKHPEDASGRERLMKAAHEMFTTRGFANVGIHEVTAGAGVARMTLYNDFSSKNALVLAVYQDLMAATLTGIVQDKGESEEERVLALFSPFESKAKTNSDRGCPFVTQVCRHRRRRATSFI